MNVPLYPPGTILEVLGGDKPWGVLVAGHLDATEMLLAVQGQVPGVDVSHGDISQRWAVHNNDGWWPDDTLFGVNVFDQRVAATLWRDDP
jgi:hypothetical protein